MISKGEGQPVLLVHGASANAREFTFTLAPEFEAGQFELLMADRPGHGYSEQTDNSHSLAAQAKAMSAIVAAKTDQPVVVVGHSFGGAVALRFALDYPEATKAVVLSAPVTHDWGGGGMTWYNQIASIPLIGHAFSQFAPLVGPSAARSSLDNLFHPAPVPEGYAENLGVDLLFRPAAFRANAKDVLRLQAEIGAQQTRYATELNLPIIVFSGSQDTVIKPELHVARLKRELPAHVIVVKLDDEGHMPHHRKAGLMAETISRLARGESVQTSDFENSETG